MNSNTDEKILLVASPNPKTAIFWTAMQTLRLFTVPLGMVIHLAFIIIFCSVVFSMQMNLKTLLTPTLNAIYNYPIPGFEKYAAEILDITCTILILLISFFYVWFKRRRSSHEYCITNQRCIIKNGLWSYEKIAAPINRIESAYIQQDISERIFGLNSVYIIMRGASVLNTRNQRVEFSTSTTSNNQIYSKKIRLYGLTREKAEEILKIINQNNCET